MEEIWKDLIYPKLSNDKNCFKISTLGRLKNTKTNHIYKPSKLSSGYLSVRVSLGSRDQKLHIILHKAVAYTFLENSDNLPEINHKDGDKTNNDVTNLEWCTSHTNQQHKYDIGLFDKSKISGENNHASKLTWEDVQYIRENYIKGSRTFGERAMARKFSVSKQTISNLLARETWKKNNFMNNKGEIL